MSDQPTEHKDASPPRTGGQRPWITNLVLLGVVLSLSVWVLLGEPETKPRGITPPMGKVFPHFVATDVTGFEIVRGDERIVFSRETQGADDANVNLATKDWQLEEPVRDRADDTNVNRLLNSVEHMRTGKSGQISEDELGSYTFGETLAKLSFTRPGKPTITFSVGPERAGKVIPVKLPDGSIYQVRSSFLLQVQKELWQYRDRQMLAVNKATVTGVLLEQRGAQGPGDAVRTVELVLQEGRWRLGDANGDTIATALVDDLLDKACYTRGTGVVADGPTAADLKTFGLDPPTARLTLRWPGDEAVIELGHEIGGSPQERYGRVPQKPTIVYRVNMARLYEAFAREAGDYLHPGVFPLEGGEASISGIHASFRDDDPFAVEKIEEDNDWMFSDTQPIQLAKNEECVALAKSLLQLRIRDRLPKPLDEAELGFDDPELAISLRQASVVHTLVVGGPIPGEPGVYNVKRKEPESQLAFFYTCDLADLPFRLRDGMLDLRHPTLFGASSWNVDKVTVLDEAGSETFVVERDLNPGAGGGQAIPKWKVAGARGATDNEQVKAFMKQFDDLQAEKWLALDSSEARRSYGLAPSPRKIRFRLKELAAGGKLETSTRTLLLGDRTGERIHAMAEGGPAIGLIDAGFLDRIARGFSKGTPLLEFKWHDVTGLVVEHNGEEVASFKRPGMHWIRDRILIVKATEFQDTCIKPWDPVTINAVELADDRRLEECGLKSPEWKLTFTVDPPGGDAVERVVNVGNGKGLGDRTRWASSGGDTIGSWYDGPLRNLEEYLRLNPKPQPPKTPKSPDEDDHKGR